MAQLTQAALRATAQLVGDFLEGCGAMVRGQQAWNLMWQIAQSGGLTSPLLTSVLAIDGDHMPVTYDSLADACVDSGIVDHEGKDFGLQHYTLRDPSGNNESAIVIVIAGSTGCISVLDRTDSV